MPHPYKKGLHDIGNGCWAYLLPDGGWGWSNAGLITDGGESLLVDTLFDLHLTREMLQAMRDATPAAARIDTLVNTHANGDHTFGNQLVEGARIVSTKPVQDAVAAEDVEQIMQLMQTAPGDAGAFLREIFSPFDFRGISPTPATETFDGSCEVKVGSKSVHLIDVGPAHTSSDVLAYVPQDKVVYTGDILFENGHPVIWSGPVANWKKACDLILSWDVDVVVPGHGKICDKRAVAAFRGYLDWIYGEARKRFDAGLSYEGTGEAVPLGEITEQHFDAAFDLNTRGTLFTVQKALPIFNDGGSIFMTGSNASVKGFPGFSVYAASKAALRSFARTWLNELKSRNIRVNLLVPGQVATPILEQVFDEATKRQFESLIPRGKMGRPEEIATVALFLASDDSSYVNGVELFVDGGTSAI